MNKKHPARHKLKSSAQPECFCFVLGVVAGGFTDMYMGFKLSSRSDKM